MSLHLVYDPLERVVAVEARPNMYQSACPRGDTFDMYIPFAASTTLVLPGREG